MSESIPIVKGTPGPLLVKKMLELAPAFLAGKEPITQMRMAMAIHCHRHWFRRHSAKYDRITGEPSSNGLTPLEILESLEIDRQVRQLNGDASPVEQALINAHADNLRMHQQVKSLQAELAVMRETLHLVAFNRERLGIEEKELLRELV